MDHASVIEHASRIATCLPSTQNISDKTQSLYHVCQCYWLGRRLIWNPSSISGCLILGLCGEVYSAYRLGHVKGITWMFLQFQVIVSIMLFLFKWPSTFYNLCLHCTCVCMQVQTLSPINKEGVQGTLRSSFSRCDLVILFSCDFFKMAPAAFTFFQPYCKGN